MKRIIVTAAALVPLLGLSVVLVAFASSATFDGSPPAPLGHQDGAFLDGWSVNVHERSMAYSPGGALGDGIHPLDAQHGADCASPPATHFTGTSRSAAVFQCRDHVMTALNGIEYGAIYLMPPALVDFSAGPAVIQWDMSTEKLSARDWWDLTVSPFTDSQSLPLLSDLSQGVDLQGPNRNAVFIGSDNAEGSPKLRVVRDGNWTAYGSQFGGARPGDGVAAGTNEAATRQTFRLTVSTTSARFERLASSTAPALVFWEHSYPALSWTQGTVQWGHHSYTPEKDNAGVPATWHWDSFSIDPSIPFYLKHYPVYFGGSGTLTTDPAPAGAYLRFSAVCRVSVDGVIASKMVYTGNPINASSYMVPVAEGSTSHAIAFSNDDWYTTGLGCNAKDFDVVSLNGGVPSSTPTASSSPTPLPTSTATLTPTPTATASPVPTATPTAPPTPTPTPQACRVQVRNSLGNWTYNVGLGSYTGTMVAGECRR